MSRELPFPLAYLDWCKKWKKVKSITDTERKDWIREFYYSEEWGQKGITSLDLIIANGGKQ